MERIDTTLVRRFQRHVASITVHALLAMLALLGPALCARPARADGAGPTPLQIARFVKAAVVVPVEWDGIYSTVDTTYTCAGAFQSKSASTDTICGGKDYSPGGSYGSITITCTGTADATSFSMTCTGSGPVFTDCDVNYSIVTHGTLSGSTVHTVSVINITYTGTGTGCSFLPPTCMQTDSWGTRTGPAPSAYCATPARTTSWGRLKTHYR